MGTSDPGERDELDTAEPFTMAEYIKAARGLMKELPAPQPENLNPTEMPDAISPALQASRVRPR